jgi:hypothetical protein
MSRSYQGFQTRDGQTVTIHYEPVSPVEIDIIEAVNGEGRPVALSGRDTWRAEERILDMLAEETDTDAFRAPYEDPYRPNSLAGDL